MSVLRRLLAVLPYSSLDASGGERLKRVLGIPALIAIGVGGTIGVGIFVLTGTVAANNTGPALTLAFLIAGSGCALAALSYSELAAMMPVSGSAYTYTYVTLGEGLAWFVGWNLILEYALSASTVAVGWSGYVVNLLGDIGVHLPAWMASAPLVKGADGHLVASGALINFPAVLIIGLLSGLLYVGISESSGANTWMVAVKVGVILIFIGAGLRFVDPGLWHPYVPANTGEFGKFGWSGVFQGAAIICLSYLGFDTATTTALETKDPQRAVPIGILGALAVSAVLYIAMSAVMTGMVSYTKLDVDAPVAVALDVHPQLGWLSPLVKLGAIAGMTSVILMSLLGQPRIFMAMADDGLLPPAMSRCHPRYKTPHVATAITGIGAAAFAGLFPLDVLGELVSIGILMAFVAVCIGVLVLRRRQPDAPRPFRVPFAPVTCTLGAVACFGMTYALPNDTWWRLVIWTIVGSAVYFAYGYRHSRLRK